MARAIRYLLIGLLLFSPCVFAQIEDAQLFVVSHNYKWGFATRSGKIAIPLVFDYTDEFSDGMAVVCLDIVVGRDGQSGLRFRSIEKNIDLIYRDGLVERDGVWGFYDRARKFIGLPQFERNWNEIKGNYPHPNGAIISAGRRCGFVNSLGKVVVPIRYEGIRSFHSGLAALRQNDRKGYGYIDKSGNFAIQPRFEQARDFYEGMAAVKIKGKWGFVGRTGRFRIGAHYDDVMGSFYKGLVAVRKGEKWGLIGRSGRIAVPFVFDDIDWLEGYREEGLVGVEVGEKRGFIDFKGNVIIALRYENVHQFRNGLAAVELNGKYGFIDNKGNIVIDFIYDYASYFNEGLARIEVDGKIGFINERGIDVISPLYDDAKDFSGGLAVVAFGSRTPLRIPGKKYGYVDKTGKVVIPIQFDFASDFKKGRAYVELGDNQCYIDEHGETVLCSLPN